MDNEKHVEESKMDEENKKDEEKVNQAGTDEKKDTKEDGSKENVAETTHEESSI